MLYSVSSIQTNSRRVAFPCYCKCIISRALPWGDPVLCEIAELANWAKTNLLCVWVFSSCERSFNCDDLMAFKNANFIVSSAYLGFQRLKIKLGIKSSNIWGHLKFSDRTRVKSVTPKICISNSRFKRSYFKRHLPVIS